MRHKKAVTTKWYSLFWWA